ncbi:putative tetrahydrocannabinolic acid synthase-like [Capsicum annuum]|nr:putative tetrahydrocannabinolic acid synthase-like [Capsicum annuum]
MGSLQILSVLFSVLFLTKYYSREDFFRCLSKCCGTNVTQNVYIPNSPTYLSILEYAQKNPRWINSSHPNFIASPRKESEIKPVILCAKKLGLLIKIKSGGHDYEGMSYRSEYPFVMLDLSNLNKIEIDWKEETVWVQAGATLGQLYYVIANKSNVHGFPGGICFSVGTGGLISGGGLGTMMRKFGVAADNVVDTREMDVNGKILDKKTMRKDLFWAIRGGGGASFGVILAWNLKLVRVPEKVTVFSVGKKLEGKDKYIDVIFQALFLGPVDELIPLLKEKFPEFDLELKDCFQEPVVDCSNRPCIKKQCRETTWIESVLYFYGKRTNESLEVLLDKSIPTQKNYNKRTSDFVKTPIPKSGWKMVQRLFLEEERPQMILEPLGGKLDEISEFEIPFPHRTGNLYNIQYLINWGDNSENVSSQKLVWMRKLYKDMEPYVANSPRTAYLNYILILDQMTRTTAIPRLKYGVKCISMAILRGWLK